MNKNEICAVIKFLTLEGSGPRKVHDRLTNIYGDAVPSCKIVCNWSREFRRGRTSLRFGPRPRRPRPATTEDLVVRAHKVVEEDRRYTLWQVAKIVGIGLSW